MPRGVSCRIDGREKVMIILGHTYELQVMGENVIKLRKQLE